MRLKQSFTVQAPAERVWTLLSDLASVAPCLPGAELTDQGGDSYEGAITVKLGVTTASYRGHIHVQQRDDKARRAVMHASAEDEHGQGAATATLITQVGGVGDRSDVTVDTELEITGKHARFASGAMFEGISNKLLAEFARCLEARLAEGAARV